MRLDGPPNASELVGNCGDGSILATSFNEL